jgi:hypothetical protein
MSTGSGEAGPPGPQGEKGEFNFRGAWKAATAYLKGDAVESKGSTYACIKAMSVGEDVEPPNATFWALVAKEGKEGPAGAAGEKGEKGTTGEKGEKGTTGETGPAGAPKTAKEPPLEITGSEITIKAEGITNALVKAKSLEGNRLAKETLGNEEIQTNAIDARTITAGAVTEAKIGAEAVSEGKIKGEAVTAGKIATDAVTAVKIKEESVTAAKIATGAVTETKLGAEAVAEAKIKNEAVTAAKIATGAVTETKLGAESVSIAKIKEEAVQTNKIKTEAVTSPKIATGAVTESKLGEAAVTNLIVKKESLGGDRLTKETLKSEQVELHGLTVDRLKEAELTNAYIKPAAAIEESKLSLPGVVHIAGTETITGLKTFTETVTATGVGGSSSGICIKAGPAEPVSTASNINALQFVPTYTLTAAGLNATIFAQAGELTFEGAPGVEGPVTLVRSKVVVKTTAGVNSAQARIFNVTASFRPPASTSGWGATGIFWKPELRTEENATGAGFTVIEAAPTCKTAKTGCAYEFHRGLLMKDVNNTGVFTTAVAVDVEDLKNSGTNYSLRSTGKAVKLLHEGPVELGETLKVTGASTLAEVKGTAGVFSTTLKVKETLTAEGAATVAKTLKVTELTTATGGLTVEGTLTLPTESITEAATKKESISKEKLTKAAQEELMVVSAPSALGAYTSAKIETEPKATLITLVITLKAEAAAGTVKLVNSAVEQVYKWDGIALGAQKVPLTFMVKKAGEWKATLEGAIEKAEVSRVTIGSV